MSVFCIRTSEKLTWFPVKLPSLTLIRTVLKYAAGLHTGI